MLGSFVGANLHSFYKEEFRFSLQGLTKESLKHHFALWPLMGIMAAGMTFVGWYVIRLATTSPEVSWSKQPEIYNQYHNKRYKLLNPHGLDYEKMNDQIPDYKKDN